MASSNIIERFEVSGRMRNISFLLMGIGAIAFLIGLFTKGISSDEHERAVFLGTVMYNSVFWLLICNASMFFICATTLAMGGWQTAIRRVPEAISTLVPVFGIITFLVFVYIIFIDKNEAVYHWINREHVEHDAILKGKSGFLSPGFFLIWTTLAIAGWWILGKKMRSISRKADEDSLGGEGGQSFIWKNTVFGSMFIVWFGLTVGSTIPWLWLMSLDPHWYSTMYSWYTFASSFVSGMSLIALWIIYLKNKGHLAFANEEHLHDIGKFMFAFSIFWTYLWFSQYMLIWYSNQPEETIYFKHRVQGAYKGIFFFNLIINFVAPILILMKRGTKRNYTMVTFMAVLIIFGHWIDFYQMVMGSISKDHVTLSWLDFGVWCTVRRDHDFLYRQGVEQTTTYALYHPFLKESIIHHT